MVVQKDEDEKNLRKRLALRVNIAQSTKFDLEFLAISGKYILVCFTDLHKELPFWR